jgi:hypothetical protein
MNPVFNFIIHSQTTSKQSSTVKTNNTLFMGIVLKQYFFDKSVYFDGNFLGPDFVETKKFV